MPPVAFARMTPFGRALLFRANLAQGGLSQMDNSATAIGLNWWLWPRRHAGLQRETSSHRGVPILKTGHVSVADRHIAVADRCVAVRYRYVTRRDRQAVGAVSQAYGAVSQVYGAVSQASGVDRYIAGRDSRRTCWASYMSVIFLVLGFFQLLFRNLISEAL